MTAVNRWIGISQLSRMFFVSALILASAAAADLSIKTAALPSGLVGTPYSFTMDGDGGKTPYVWSASGLPSPLVINSGTGRITGTPGAGGQFPVVITLRDANSTTVTGTFTLTINTPLTITTASPLPTGNVLSPYSQTLAASGGTPPYTWSRTSGNLPTGLTLSSGGAISGTPMNAGTSSFEVQVADSTSDKVKKTFSLTINPALPAPLSIATQSPLPAGTVGGPYSQALSATGGTPPYSWSVSGSLPAGLTLSSGGTISGTPTAAGSSDFTVRVTDSLAQTATKPFSLIINPPALAITTASPLTSGTVGAAYSQNLSATGGTPPYQWSVVSGTPPAGLTLSSGGVLGGTPTAAGTSNFTVQVSDSAAQTATKALSVTISPAALSITTQSTLPAGTVAAPYSQNFAASGGTPPFAWAVITGPAPPGLTMSQTGTLSGTPSSAGTFGFTVQVRDTAGVTASKAFSLTVQTTLTINTASPLPTAAVNAPYSIQIEASTSDALTWSVISGNLPPGLTLSTGGLLRGTPTSLGSFDFTIQARRTSPDQTATKQFRLDVVSALVVLSLSNVPVTMDPAQQVAIGMGISTPQPNPITGTLSISFTSNSVVAGNDPLVMFSNGSRAVDFTIPANTTAAVFAPAISLQTGTVSGDVVFRADIRSGPTGLLVGSVSVRSTVPKFTNMTAVRTSGGIRIQVTGFSPDRTVTNAQFGFDVRTSSGTQRVDLSRSVQSEFDAWFRSAASAPFGSSYVFEQMFTVQGDATMIDAVTVGLTNGQGNGSSTTIRVSAN